MVASEAAFDSAKRATEIYGVPVCGPNLTAEP